MSRPSPYIIALLLLPLALLAWLLVTESGLRWVYQQARPYLPVELHMQQPEGRLIGPITVKDIEVQQDGVIIKADQILFDWQPAALFMANIDIKQVHIRTLKIDLPETESTGQAITLPDIHLPWNLDLKDAQIDNFSLIQQDQTINLKQIKLNASTLFSHIDIHELSLRTEEFNLTVKGDVQLASKYKHDLKINWQTRLPSSAMIEGNGKLKGNLQKTHITQQLRGPLQLILNADINEPLDQLDWHANINVTQFDTSLLDTNWPALSGALEVKAEGNVSTATITGKFDGSYPELGMVDAEFNLQRLSNNTIQINHLNIHAPGNDTNLAINGLWSPGNNGGDIKLSMDWKNLRWPMQDPPWFNSASGNGSIEGNIDHYQIELTTDRPWPEFPPSTWLASADGNLDGMNFNSLRVTTLNGEINATGKLNWSTQLNWQADIKAKDIDPSTLWPQWPGKIKAQLTSTGHIDHGKVITDTDITELTGVLRDHPISLTSRVKSKDTHLDIARFNFNSGNSNVNVEGHVGDTLKLDWSITTPNMAELYPETQGQLNATGTLTGIKDAPTIQATFNGQSLSMPGYQVGSFEGELSIDLFKWQQLDINLAAQALQFNNYIMQSLNITSAGNRIEAKAVSDMLTAIVELDGKVEPQGWSGQIQQADIISQQYQNWQLKEPVTINITSDTVDVHPLCWVSSDSSLCMSLNRDKDIWLATLDAKKMPMMLLSNWLPEHLVLEGIGNAAVDLKFQAPDKLTGQANIILPAGAISYPLLEGERDRWEYKNATATSTLNQQGITTKTVITMSNGDHFEFEAELPGAQLLTLDLQSQKVQAQAQMALHDMGPFEALLPEVQDLKGEVALNITADGTLAKPRLSGQAYLHNGALRIPRLGLDINQITLNGQSRDFEKLDFRLDAQSGEGNLIIQGQTILDAAAGWPTEISIKGNDFEVSKIPEARVEISPDLNLKLVKRTLNLQGEIRIPYAKLQPKDITMATRVSDDAIILGDEQIVEEKWQIYTNIRLILGDRVSFYGYGFEGQLGGSLLLEDEPGQLTKATGEITIPEGRYRAYGQRLDVEHGRILYTGGPLSNPGLDIRAVRHIENVTAGIKVKGSLNQPELELFSNPAMGETDTLSYLILGGPIDNASGEEGAMMAKAALALGLSGGDTLARRIGDRFGLDEMRVESSESGDQASLVVGRYLSPKLYVSYGVGLVEVFNTFTVRYKISDKWQLKAESGEYESADIFYTIER